MLGLRPYTAQQDENALAGLHRPAALKGGGDGGGLGVPARKGATPGFPRKALGNITNRGVDAENAPLGKTPAGAGAAPARRALGDITNSAAPSAATLQRAAQKPALQQKVAQPPAAVCTAAATAASSRVDALAEGGVERCFGRGWEQLEAGRLAREEEESQRRLASLAAFPARGLPNFFPHWGAPASMGQTLQKDALPPLPASPMAKLPPSFAGAAGGLSMPDTSDLALPDIPCAGLDFDEDLFGGGDTAF